MLNPIMAMLHNVKEQRWHPILFYESPLPGGGGPRRHKPKGHHTGGFPSRAEAVQWATQHASECEARLCLGKDFPWDGEGVPAMVRYFLETDDGLVPF